MGGGAARSRLLEAQTKLDAQIETRTELVTLRRNLVKRMQHATNINQDTSVFLEEIRVVNDKINCVQDVISKLEIVVKSKGIVKFKGDI